MALIDRLNNDMSSIHSCFVPYISRRYQRVYPLTNEETVEKPLKQAASPSYDPLVTMYVPAEMPPRLA